MKLYPHLNFGGNCEQAFRFYERLLSGRIVMMMKAKDLPPQAPRPSGSPDFVIHAHLELAGADLVGNDVPAEHFQPMRSSYVFLSLDSPAEVERVYGALKEGGEVTMPMAETFFATRFAQLRDRFGVLWTILHQRSR